MEQLFWQNNGNVCLGFGSLADNFLLFEHRQKSQEFTEIPFGQFRLNSNLRFLAKNSNARYTKSLRVGEKTVPSFLAKISDASHKSSSFSGVEGRPCFRKDSRLFGVLPKGRDGLELAFARTPGNLALARTPGQSLRFAATRKEAKLTLCCYKKRSRACALLLQEKKQSFALPLQIQIRFARRDKNKIIY